jgi:hypothetical protein
VSTLTAATWVFALLLVVVGTGKVARPAATRPPSDERLARLLGAGEVGLGSAVLWIGGPVATTMLAVAYASFAVFAEHQRRRGRACGCLSTTTTPPTTVHVWLNVTAAAAAAGAALRSGASLPATIAAEPLHGLLVLGLLAVAAGVLWLLLTAAPDLSAAVALVDPRTDA